MRCANGFFKLTDPKVGEIGGHQLLPSWWSRFYEYPWAMQFAEPGQIVADMGCGYTFRPLKNALAQVVERVYAIDGNPQVLDLDAPENCWLVVANFTDRIPLIEEESIDRVFCISVLEDLQKGDMIEPALTEFSRVLAPDGLMVLTFDVPYDDAKPCEHYPGLDLGRFEASLPGLGLEYVGEVDHDKGGAVVHEAYNLCVWHCVLRKA